MSFEIMKRFGFGLLLGVLAYGPVAHADDDVTAPAAEQVIVEPKSTPIAERGERGFIPNAHQKELIAKAEATFNAIQSMSARFMQSASTGDFAEGNVFLSKPGRLRIEYDPPVPVLVIANNDYFTFIDREMEQRSYLSLNNTPAGVLLRKSVNLTTDDIRVVDIHEEPSVAVIVVTSKSDPTIGKLSLIFSKKPFAFRQWQVTDAQGITTTVTLDNIKTGVTLDSKLFKVPKES